MIAEVQMEEIVSPAGRAKGRSLHSGLPQCLEIRSGKFFAANAVVEEVDFDAICGFFDEQVAKFPTQFIVADDEELDENVALGSSDRPEYRRKGGLAIYEQFQLVSACE